MPRSGPSTAVGKAIVSLNAVRHGITSAQIVIPGLECHEDWVAFRESMVSDLEPLGAVEQDLAEQVAATAWRRRRIGRHESNLVAAGIERVPSEFALSAAWAQRPGSVEEATADFERTRAARDLLARLDAAPPRKRQSVAVCMEVIDAATLSDLDLAVGVKGLPAQEEWESFGWTVEALRSVLRHVARARAMPLAALLEETAEALERAVERRQREIERVRDELDRMRRQRTLPDAPTLIAIARYEAHLDRQYYRALHELKDLQARRRGEPPPMTRVEVHGLPGA